MSKENLNKPAIREIPGFYYDEDTKKYFRITKDHPGPKRKAEKTPIRKDFEVKGPLISSLQIFQNREIHCMSSEKVRRALRRTSIRSLKLRKETDLKLRLEDAYLPNSASISHIVPCAKQDMLAVVSKCKGSDKSILQIYDFKFSKDRIFEIVAACYVSIGQICDVKFSPFGPELLISSINERLNRSQADVVWVDGCFVAERVVEVYKNQSIWSSCFVKASSSVERKIALGLSNGVMVVGPDRRVEKHHFVRTSRSDVLALSCSNMGDALYSGSRDGCIRCYDFRRRRIVAAAKAKKSIDNLKMLKNDIHLLVSTMAGHLELWDVRSWRPVLTYHGHSNTHSLLSLDTDDCEDFIAAVGEDCTTRIWDLRTAECLRELPSFRFDDAGEPIKPSVLFLDQLTHSNNSSGLLYGISDEFYHYCL